ncbi:hypothetical protein P4O66_019089 [Electrophorus voltai]|uniref:Uncharacterized protein n=1 Tax=Electrophorus voltai TaxID=2609070 RepID=A0AAD8YNB4_9TELE|nr:hypothetical protein P4O66_019089 [Electrophorus voltai]
MDSHQLAYRPNRSLTHMDRKNTYVRILFIDYSSSINTQTHPKTDRLGSEHPSLQLDTGLPDEQTTGGIELCI